MSLKLKAEILKILKEITQIWGVIDEDLNTLNQTHLSWESFHNLVMQHIHKYIEYYGKLYDEATDFLKTNLNKLIGHTSEDCEDYLKPSIFKRHIIGSYILGEVPSDEFTMA